jgi:hypothetical protein
MADFKTPNLCGANPELNNALSKLEDLKNDIASKLDSTASEAAAAFETGLANVKAGLDGLALDLPELPDVNFQSELTGLINDVDRTTIQGIAAFNTKLAQLELDFGDTLKEKGLSLDTLITDATTKLSSGGNLCELAPNIEIPAGSSGTGVTTEEKEERGSGTSITISETPKEIISLEGKKAGASFFGNVTYKQSGKTLTTTQIDNDNNLISYTELKVKYIISLIKEKPVEAKQADTSPEAEEFSSVTVNASVEEVRQSLKTKQQDIDTGEIFSRPDDTGFVKKADPIKDVEPVVTKVGTTIKVTTPAKSTTVTNETITTTTGGGYTQTYSAPVTKRKVQSDNGLSTRRKFGRAYYVLKGSVNESYWSGGGKMFKSTKRSKKHKVVDDISKLTLPHEFTDIKLMVVRVETKAVDLTATGIKAYYGRDRDNGYKRLDYQVRRKTKKEQTLNEISYEFPTSSEPKLLELVDEKTFTPLTEGTRAYIVYEYYEKVDPNFSG